MTSGPRYRSRVDQQIQKFVGREWVRNWNEPGAPIWSEHLTGTVLRPDHDLSVSGERCWDETHPPVPLRRRKRVSSTGVHFLTMNEDAGGPFWDLRSDTPWHEVQASIHIDNGPGGFQRGYDGGFAPSEFGPPEWMDFSIMSGDRLTINDYGDPTPYGTQAWNNFKPKFRLADVPLFLYELKDLPQMLKTTAGGFHDIYRQLGGKTRGPEMGPKKVADHFLNHQFGWRPFVKDILDVSSGVSNLDKFLGQLRRDNGKVVRRRGTILKSKQVVDEYTDNTQKYPSIYPVLDVRLLRLVENEFSGIGQWGQSFFSLEEEKEIWFSGAFQYFIPGGLRMDDTYWRVINTTKAFGGRVNPSLLWKATPWTWLADWFANTGDILDNVADMNEFNLVAKYAYIMCRLVRRVIHRANLFLSDSSTVQCQWTQELRSKRREKASPFGFGLTPDMFSPRQLMILGALGMSKR